MGAGQCSILQDRRAAVWNRLRCFQEAGRIQEIKKAIAEVISESVCEFFQIRIPKVIKDLTLDLDDILGQLL